MVKVYQVARTQELGRLFKGKELKLQKADFDDCTLSVPSITA
jgi:hypothetical protein